MKATARFMGQSEDDTQLEQLVRVSVADTSSNLNDVGKSGLGRFGASLASVQDYGSSRCALKR